MVKHAWRATCFALGLALWTLPVQGRDLELERRVADLSGQLRCLVCQNQTIADSQAPLALELKKQVAEQLAQGRSEQDVLDFMVQRYGDFVLYRPPLKAATWLLWFGPLLFLVAGLVALWLVLRRQAGQQLNLDEGETT